jgi:hypothetical protein
MWSGHRRLAAGPFRLSAARDRNHRRMRRRRTATCLLAGVGELATNESATALRMNMVPTTQPTDQAKIESVRRSSIAVFPVPRSGRVQEPKRLFIEKVRWAMRIVARRR